jgi:hypothetical protein
MTYNNVGNSKGEKKIDQNLFIMQMWGPFRPSLWLAELATNKKMSSEFAKLHPLLNSLPPNSYVAVVLMVGSYCPFTLGHVQSFVEARRVLLSSEKSFHVEPLAEMIGLIGFNPDSYVRPKLRDMGDTHMCLKDRMHVATLATREFNWLTICESSFEVLRANYTNLQFIRFHLNGADDVCRYRKWRHCGENYRIISMGRPGTASDGKTTLTDYVAQNARLADIKQGFFIIGPELKDISSTQARHLLRGNAFFAYVLIDGYRTS